VVLVLIVVIAKLVQMMAAVQKVCFVRFLLLIVSRFMLVILATILLCIAICGKCC